ncbi:MAG: GNAT family N-acetyltransferase [Proteobacteria bacterium]|nr:GNAT family N-acetyltransferase [Pseudomonadota bacterium]
MGEIRAPEVITSEHELDEFDCGNNTLNEWLKKRALENQDKFSFTRVVCVKNKVIAYYTLVFGSINRSDMTKKMQRNAPERIPVMILGRLAVDRRWHGQGIAKHLLKEAMLKTLEASTIAATRCLLVHAIDEDADAFYKHFGFIESKVELTLMLTIEDIKAQI